MWYKIKKAFNRTFDHFINFDHIFTPLAIERYYMGVKGSGICAVVHIFGIRVAYFNLAKQ